MNERYQSTDSRVRFEIGLYHLNALLGTVYAVTAHAVLRVGLHEVQKRLVSIRKNVPIEREAINYLTNATTKMKTQLVDPELEILPGGTLAGAFLYQAQAAAAEFYWQNRSHLTTAESYEYFRALEEYLRVCARYADQDAEERTGN